MKSSEKQLARAFVHSLDGVNTDQVEIAAAKLIDLLASRNEIHRVRGVIDAIEDVWAEQYGAATITIETAHPLVKSLREKLEKIAPGVEIKEKVRSEIIGGAKLRIDETIIDGSVEGYLTRLTQAFKNA